MELLVLVTLGGGGGWLRITLRSSILRDGMKVSGIPLMMYLVMFEIQGL